MDPRTERKLEELSPFELKDELIRYAKDFTQSKAATHKFLNAGRGNPNWVATTPREAFFLLGQFSLTECKRVWDEPGLGGMPHKSGIAERLKAYLSSQDSPGATLLSRSIDYGVKLGLEADELVHELCDSVIGDNYPVPDRMLKGAEAIVHRYLEKELFGGTLTHGKLDLFAVEGGTAAMCYVFNTLLENQILKKGDTIALGTPIFTPYLEIARLNDFDFRTVEVKQSEMQNGLHTWQYPEEEIAKLRDPSVKAFFCVNPSNPASFAMQESTHQRLVELVKKERPDLLILTDDVYATFVPGFRSLAADLPRNTILVYSYSKHFGCTGWRLGVIALHQDNILDDMLRKQTKKTKAMLRKRYGSISTDPDGMKIIDRMVADSRAVALNHTAGLSLPQQTQMTLFSLFALLDESDSYKDRCRAIVHERFDELCRGLGITFPTNPLRAAYYADLDLEAWGRANFGEDFMRYVESHHEPLDIVLALARRQGTVLLNGSGFDGPPWSARVSLANLNKEEYAVIGKDLQEIARAAVAEWKRQQGEDTGTSGATH